MEIKPKIVLKQKGQIANMDLNKFTATLRWKTSSDLDLHVFYQTKDNQKGHVYFGAQSARSTGVDIKLDGDAGVGNTMSGVGGSNQYSAFNEENVHFNDISNIKYAVIAANIYSGGVDFKSLGGHVMVGKDANNPEVEVPLDSPGRAKWCTVARLDNSGITPQLKNIDSASNNKPSAESDGSSSSGMLGKLFGR